MSTQWRCSICLKQILYSELFTFYSKGAVHYTCFREYAKKSSIKSVDIMLEMLEKELKMIVDYKRYINEVSEDIKQLLSDNEKDAEKHAALLTKMIDNMIK
ncbi:MAG: DUF2175 family protein [Candidatus Nitrosocaldaceae archaeon]